MTEPTSKTFDLKHPITVRGGAVVSTLTARDPKVRDIKKFLKQASAEEETGAVMTVLADLCEVPVETIAEVHVRDYFKMKEWFVGFFKPTNDE